MKRRAFSIGAAACALGVVLPTVAQQPSRHYRIGMLLSEPRETDLEEVFVETLHRAGFVQGRNLEIKWMYSYDLQQVPDQARELMVFRPDALVSEGVYRTRILQALTSTIPILSVAADHVGSNLVNSLARPGGNTTGVSTQGCALLAKKIEILKELVPSARRLYVVVDALPSLHPCQGNPETANSEVMFVAIESGERGMTTSLQSLTRERPDGAVILSSRIKEIAEALSLKRVPIVSYGLRRGIVVALYPNVVAMVRREGELVVRILRGAKPSRMPVELVSQFQLEVDLRQAKQLGIRVPDSILLRADRVLQ